MKYIEVYKNGISQLKSANNENAVFEVRCIFQKCFNMNRYELALSENSEAPLDGCEYFNEIIKRRKSQEPLQYILGSWEFMGLEFDVGKGVLIPRPETELLVETAIDEIRKTQKTVFDLCAGSGCIGLSIAYFCSDCDVYLIEKSKDALKYLKLNTKKYELSNVHIIEGDITDGFESFNLPNPHIIVSNPPYIKTDEIDTLQTEVLYEPKMALDGGADGLYFYKVLSEKWMPYILANGILSVECGENQYIDIEKLFLKHSDNINIKRDFNGIIRIITAKI